MAKEEHQPDDPQDLEKALASAERLQDFGATLASTRDKWIRHRAATGWDRRVAQDTDQYHGIDAATRAQSQQMMDVVESGGPNPQATNQARSTVFIGITRQKTNASEARLADILLPTDDRNWGLQPTPDPDCAIAIEDHDALVDPVTNQPVLVDAAGNVTDDATVGKPLTKSLIAKATQWIAYVACQAMQTEIDDQLVEAEYNSEIRKMLHDAAVTGTGVLKGPMVVRRTRKAWRQKTGKDGKKSYHTEVIEDLKPASYRVDPRMLWEDPSCGDDVKNGKGIFELEVMTKRQVRDLGKQPGYIKEQLRQALQEGPKKSAAITEARHRFDENKGGPEDVFYHWIYWGELEVEDLVAAGVKVPGVKSDDVLESVCGCVEMINDTVVRAYLNPIEDAPIPFDFYPWEKVSDSTRGYGIPYLMRSQQSVINAAWRQMMDNAGISSGPQIVIKQGQIEPVDGSWVFHPRKFWWAKEDTPDINKAFATFEFNSHQGELAAIIELAEKLTDQETATPMMAQGQQGSAPDTVGGMQLLMNSANVVLRRLVKQFDDYITKPHLRRYYDYNMLYNEKESIKGDFNVDARGSSALVIRDIQNQAYTNLLGTAANPFYAPMVNARKLYEKALQAQHIDPREIMYTEEEVKANAAKNPPQPDPKVQAAMITAQSRVDTTQAVQAGVTAQIESRNQSDSEDRKLRLRTLEVTRELKIIELAEKQKMSVQEVKAQLAGTAMANNTKKELAAAEMAYANANPNHEGI